MDHADHAVEPAHAASATRAACPRCGYRLDGEVSSWSQRCPLQGTCAECGDAINWSHVLVPHKYEPRWSFEHAQRRRLAQTFASTTLRLAHPKRFWTQLKMSDAVRPRRLAMYLGIVIALVLVGLAAVQSVVSVVYWSKIYSGRAVPFAERYSRASGTYYQWASQRERIWVTSEHFPTPWPIILDGLRRPFADDAEYLIVVDGENWYVNELGARARLLAVVDRVSLFAAQGLHAGTGWSLAGYAHGMVATAVIALSFVLLPWTRARCGVRWRHLARIWIYSLPMMLVITAALVMFGAVGGLLVPGFVVVGFHVHLNVAWGLIYLFAVPAYTFMWWGRAMSRHLRLPRPWFVTSLLMVLLVLLFFVVMSGITIV